MGLGPEGGYIIEYLSRLTARKSMGPGSRAGPRDACRNVSRKSTGPQVYIHPQTSSIKLILLQL